MQQNHELKDQHITRQIDLIPAAILEMPVTIIGCGSIGSFTALALAKMGWRHLHLIDMDKVDIVNMSCQFHGFKDIGIFKAFALAERIKEMTGGTTTCSWENKKWEGETYPGVVIPAVDNLAVRRHVWEAHLDSFQTKFIVDARMGAEVASLYVMNPQDPKDRSSYPKSLTDDSKASEAPCTAKSTTYTAIMLGGLIAQAVKDALTSKPYLRTADWNLKQYIFRGWMSDGTPIR